MIEKNHPGYPVHPVFFLYFSFDIEQNSTFKKMAFLLESWLLLGLAYLSEWL